MGQKQKQMRTGIRLYGWEVSIITLPNFWIRYIRTEKRQQEGYSQTFDMYRYKNCGGCRHKEKYLYKYNADKKMKRIRRIPWGNRRDKTRIPEGFFFFALQEEKSSFPGISL